MELNIGMVTITFPPLYISIIVIIVIILLVRWSNQMETRRFTVFSYFLISTYIVPVYSQGTKNGIFELWLPIGFIFILIYLFSSKKYHPSKIKASILGFSIAIYQLILQYSG